MDLLDNFLKYVKIDTQSDENSNSSPSTFKQYDLLNLLKCQILKLFERYRKYSDFQDKDEQELLKNKINWFEKYYV